MPKPAMFAVAAAMLAAAALPAGDKPEPKNLLTNGSFEDGPDVPADPGFLPTDKDSEAIKGWIVTRGQVDLIDGYWKAAAGKRSLDLHGSPGVGGVKQTVATVKGKKYKLTFQLASNPGGAPKKFITAAAGDEKKEFTFDIEGKSTADMGWVEKSFEFTAAGDKTDIELYSTTPDDDSAGPALDDVKLVEVK